MACKCGCVKSPVWLRTDNGGMIRVSDIREFRLTEIVLVDWEDSGEKFGLKLEAMVFDSDEGVVIVFGPMEYVNWYVNQLYSVIGGFVINEKYQPSVGIAMSEEVVDYGQPEKDLV